MLRPLALGIVAALALSPLAARAMKDGSKHKKFAPKRKAGKVGRCQWGPWKKARNGNQVRECTDAVGLADLQFQTNVVDTKAGGL